jgi:hypothetical protein
MIIARQSFRILYRPYGLETEVLDRFFSFRKKTTRKKLKFGGGGAITSVKAPHQQQRRQGLDGLPDRIGNI